MTKESHTATVAALERFVRASETETEEDEDEDGMDLGTPGMDRAQRRLRRGPERVVRSRLWRLHRDFTTTYSEDQLRLVL